VHYTESRPTRVMEDTMPLRRQFAALCSALALTALAVAPALADVATGDVINKDNKDKVSDLVSPGVMWCIDHGMTMKIAPYQKM